MVSTSGIGHSKRLSRRHGVSLRCNTMPCTTSKTPITTSAKNINRRPCQTHRGSSSSAPPASLDISAHVRHGTPKSPSSCVPPRGSGPPLVALTTFFILFAFLFIITSHTDTLQVLQRVFFGQWYEPLVLVRRVRVIFLIIFSHIHVIFPPCNPATTTASAKVGFPVR
jgi:hypothetical protein